MYGTLHRNSSSFLESSSASFLKTSSSFVSESLTKSSLRASLNLRQHYLWESRLPWNVFDFWSLESSPHYVSEPHLNVSWDLHPHHWKPHCSWNLHLHHLWKTHLHLHLSQVWIKFQGFSNSSFAATTSVLIS